MNICATFSDIEFISDTIYQVSSIMDGRRWAEEYVKRREAANQGVVMEAGPVGGAEAKGSGGWNEVAKGKVAPQHAQGGKLETGDSFRVVAKGKKGRRA